MPILFAASRCRLALAAAILATSCSSAPFQIRSRSVNGATYVYTSDVARYYGLRQFFDGERLILYGEDGRRLELTPEKRRAKINGVVMHLALAPSRAQGLALLSERDLTLTVDPILRRPNTTQQQVRRICLDAGHGGKDKGARGRRTLEKDVNLAVCLKLKPLLERDGYIVGLTRSDDTFVSLSGRAAIAKTWGADLFISVHCNSAGRNSVHGLETFIMPPLGTPNTSSHDAHQTTQPGNAFDSENTRLAYEVQRYALAATSAGDRGIKRERFQVLREAPCPAVLVETGFLSNHEDERRLSSEAYQLQLAAGLRNAVVAYHHAIADR